MIALVLLLSFAAIQLVLIWSSYRMLDSTRQSPEQVLQTQKMGLGRGTELLWTCLPLVATVALLLVVFLY